MIIDPQLSLSHPSMGRCSDTLALQYLAGVWLRASLMEISAEISADIREVVVH